MIFIFVDALAINKYLFCVVCIDLNSVMIY